MKTTPMKKGERYEEFKRNVKFGCRSWYHEYVSLKECGLPVPKEMRETRDAYLKHVATIEKRYTYLARMFMLDRRQVRRIVEGK